MRIKYLFLTTVFTLIFISHSLAGDNYVIDPVHSKVGFSVRHFVISNVEGRFKDFSGTISYDEKDIANSWVKVTIKVASISTDNEKRDSHLKSPDFFDAEKYPEITFVSNKIIQSNDGYVAVGDLTMRGVTKEIEVPFVIHGTVKDPWGNTRLGAEANLSLNRMDYGIKWNNKLEGGGLVVGEEVKINLSIEAIKQNKGTN